MLLLINIDTGQVQQIPRGYILMSEAQAEDMAEQASYDAPGSVGVDWELIRSRRKEQGNG